MTIKINSNTNSIEVNDVPVAIPTGGGSIVTTNDTGTVSTTMLADAGVTTAKLADSGITAAKLNNGSYTGSAGTAPIFGVRAWLSMNGTGTIQLLDSANVSSLTDIGTGRYTMNFTVAMPTDNYGMAVSANEQIAGFYGRSTTSTNLFHNNSAGSADDPTGLACVIAC